MVWLAGAWGDLTLRPTTTQARALIRLGVILRWVALAFAGLAGLLGPRAPNLLTAEILTAVIYNGLVTGAAVRATDEALPAVALVTTVIDQFFCFTFIGLYNVVPGSHQVAAYVPGMIEAVAFFGVAGAVLSTGIFFTGVLIAEASTALLGHGRFDSVGVFGSTMIVVLIATCLAAVSEVLRRTAGDGIPDEFAVPTPASPAPPRLSPREEQVLALVAQGCSTAMIASRLQVSESLVKACMRRLLTVLHARNRAELVASAIRRQLL